MAEKEKAENNIKEESKNLPLKKLYLIDGSGYIFRAFYALPMMVSPDGVPVNAVYGFVNMLFRTLERCGDKAKLCVVFDSKRKNFRHDIYPEYKANRAEPPEELVPQFELIRKACSAFGVPQVEMEGFEADDLIATYAKIAKEKGYDVVVVSSDKDLMQLVGSGVRIYDPMKDRSIEFDQVVEKFGVGPEKVVDVQALSGDSSDNIPGVPGIGPKTAALLINEYGSVENLLEKAGEIKQPKRRQALIDNKDLALVSKQLVSLRDDVPINDPDLKLCQREKFDSAKIFDFLNMLGFKSIISRMKNSGIVKHDEVGNGNGHDQVEGVVADGGEKDVQVKVHKDYKIIKSIEELDEFIARVKYIGRLAIDTETDSLDALSAEIVGISMSYQKNSGVYIPLGHSPDDHNIQKELLSFEHEADKNKNSCDEGHGEKVDNLPLYEVLLKLYPILTSSSVLKIGQNIKYDLHIIRRAGQSVGIDLTGISPIDDTMLLSYVCDNNTHGHGMDELAKIYLGHENIKYSDVAKNAKGKSVTFDKLSAGKVYAYACEDADITLCIYDEFKPARLFSDKMHFMYERVERPLIRAITTMEANGVKIDVERLREISRDLTKKINNEEEKIFEISGAEFNIGSPKQLSEVLFDKMSLTPSTNKKTKGKNISTNVEVMEDLAMQGHEIANHILNWRHYTKLKNTYVDTLEKQINPETGRVHTNFSMVGAFTGRLSSNNPNLQNIPARTAEGRAIRSAFVAGKGNSLISLDYSQVELRLLSHMADIPNMIDDFLHGKDIHRATAAKVFGIKEDEVTPDQRSHAKAINFGIIYGMSAYGLAKQLNVSRDIAQQLIDSYHAQYPQIKDFVDKMQEFARTNGYVKTMFGRKCFTPEIHSKNYSLRSNAERQAINAPLQGSAADIIKLAMIKIDDLIREQNIPAKMILQVHDELIFELPTEIAEECARKFQKIMSSIVKLKVPLIVDYGIASNWEDAH